MLYNIRRYNRYKQTYKQAVTYATYAHIVSEHQANKTHAYKQVTGARAQKQTNKTNKQTNKQTNRQTNKQANKQTNKQNKQTNKRDNASMKQSIRRTQDDIQNI